MLLSLIDDCALLEAVARGDMIFVDGLRTEVHPGHWLGGYAGGEIPPRNLGFKAQKFQRLRLLVILLQSHPQYSDSSDSSLIVDLRFQSSADVNLDIPACRDPVLGSQKNRRASVRSRSVRWGFVHRLYISGTLVVGYCLLNGLRSLVVGWTRVPKRHTDTPGGMLRDAEYLKCGREISEIGSSAILEKEKETREAECDFSLSHIRSLASQLSRRFYQVVSVHTSEWLYVIVPGTHTVMRDSRAFGSSLSACPLRAGHSNTRQHMFASTHTCTLRHSWKYFARDFAYLCDQPDLQR